MKFTKDHDPLDDLLVAALNGDLTPEERAALDTRLQNDPAARAAYTETQHMHDLLEKTHREAQPDPAFEERMISGVRQKIQTEAQHRETAWESALVLWKGVKAVLFGSSLRAHATIIILCIALGSTFVLHFASSAKRAMQGSTFASLDDLRVSDEADKDAEAKRKPFGRSREVIRREMHDESRAEQEPLAAQNAPKASFSSRANDAAMPAPTAVPPAATKLPQEEKAELSPTTAPTASTSPTDDNSGYHSFKRFPNGIDASTATPRSPYALVFKADNRTKIPPGALPSADAAPASEITNGIKKPEDITAPAPDNRKLIRNAQLELEVKAYQAAIDRIAALTKAAGGYVDTSNSQRGGNGKLQGNIVLKVLPQNLDGFLLQLRGLGEIRNQSIGTEDVTKEYFDTQARLDNSRRMETQLQDLLKRDNGKVSELLQVERELGRVRGEIEQMQGELKLYDFQVQYATVTISLAEKDLSDTSAYLLKESDQFSLAATDVEGTFQLARRAADDFKANVLSANLNRDSDGVSATLAASVPPDQIDGFLARVRQLGRVQNFTRQTQRVARDGGETDRPADETRTEKDRVLVNLTIQSDNQAQKHAALTVVTPAVETMLAKAKDAALASPGAEILSSSLDQNPQGRAAAQLSVRVPGKGYPALIEGLRGLGRVAAFSLQRDDNSGPNASGDDTPVTVALTLTDDEAPLQRTELAVSASNVDEKAQQLKKDAAASGAEVRSAGFDRQPDGSETAQMTFRVSMAGYPSFIEKLKSLGHVESLTVHREDRPEGAPEDQQAPADISFRLYSPGPIITNDNGAWAAIRRTFAQGAQALFASVTMIGVFLAFLAPWVIFLAVAVWVGRRIYVAKKGKA